MQDVNYEEKSLSFNIFSLGNYDKLSFMILNNISNQ